MMESYYINTLPILNCNLSEEDRMKITFPMLIGHLVNMRIERENGDVEDYKKSTYWKNSIIYPCKSDKLLIEIIPKKMPEICILLEALEMTQIICDIDFILQERAKHGGSGYDWFEGTTLSIVGVSNQNDCLYSGWKYYLQINVGILTVYANVIAISEVKYL